MKQKCKGLFLGILIGTTVFTATGFASNDTVQKELAYRNINIVVDGNEITPTDANGNYVEPFIMDGTTYLPVRAVANAFGKDVSWDDTTNTVSIKNQSANSQSIVGTYTTTYPIPLTLTLNADNTGNVTNGEQTVDLTWVQNENQLTLTPVNPELTPETLTVNGHRLISLEDEDLYFTKNNAVTSQENGTSATLQKDVTYRDIKIVVDGNEITPTDANGNPVEPFIMDGTTYLPVRAVANAFGKEVGWDDTTSTVYLEAQLTESNNVVGNYAYTGIEQNGVLLSQNVPEFYIILNADGTGILAGNDSSVIKTNWTLDQNSVIMTIPTATQPLFVFTVDGNDLILEIDDLKLIYAKTKTDVLSEISNKKATITMKTVTVDKSDANKPIVTIEMETGGIIKAELYPDVAPITVENFISLIEKGFYDGLTFHRNIPGFVIQGGCPNGTGTGGPGYSIKGEFASNGVENNLSHTRGVLSMARAMDPDSAGSQFFIMHADALYLDGEYAAFGMVIEGMDVVDSIANSGM